MLPEDSRYVRCRAVSSADPDDLWRSTEDEASLMKLCILGDDGKVMILRIQPNRLVVAPGKADGPNMRGAGIEVRQRRYYLAPSLSLPPNSRWW